MNLEQRIRKLRKEREKEREALREAMQRAICVDKRVEPKKPELDYDWRSHGEDA